MTGNGSGPLRVVPLGGLGEIGLNCLVLEYGQAAIAVDCGLMFPEIHMLGIDVVIPDLAYIRSLGERFLGFVLTHGHEDHIGALPYVLREIKVPLYATAMAAGLARARLREHDLDGRVEMHIFRAQQPWQMGPFTIEAIHVTHSIVDSVALAIRTPIGTVIHTGDFKLDQTPLSGECTDLQRIAEYGAEGVLLLLSDSTNVERKGITPSEQTVRAGIGRIFRETEGKIFFSTFSSHVHRLQLVLDQAQAVGRKVLVVGRSLTTSIRIATELGHLRYPPGLFAEIGTLPSLRPSQVVMLTAGSQGEPLSALVRIAMDDHAQIKMLPGDATVLSSRIIPGNEKTINNLINHMIRRGATVHHALTAEVHVSGHASQEELKLMVGLTRPRYFVPVHGEYRHLAKHRELAASMGVPADRSFLLEDGHMLEIDVNGAQVREPVGAGRVFVDGKGIGDVRDIVLRDRRHLSQDGFVLAVLVVDQQSGDLISGPDLITRGFMVEEHGQHYLEEARSAVRDALAAITPESRTDPLEVKEEARKALKRYFSRTLDRRPVILPFIMEM